MTGHIPKDYKVANLTPIIQEGQKDAANNYSLTPVVGEILESIWGGLGSEQLEKCNFIRDGQCGALRWVLTDWGFFPGIAARGGLDGDGMMWTCIFEVPVWDAAAVSLGWAAEPIGTRLNEQDDGCSLPGRGVKARFGLKKWNEGLVFCVGLPESHKRPSHRGKERIGQAGLPFQALAPGGGSLNELFWVSVQFRSSLQVMHRSGQCYCASGLCPHTQILFFCESLGKCHFCHLF